MGNINILFSDESEFEKIKDMKRKLCVKEKQDNSWNMILKRGLEK